MKYLKEVDPEIAKVLEQERQRQNDKIELIASENFVSPAVMEAQGSVLTNKYAEGYPGKRYYGGCEYVDIAEELARERVKKLFGADHANVQPHSGANANTGVYLAVLKPGDTVVGMNLAHGGHLTHGSPVNISGLYFNFIPYGVSKETQTIDYDQVAEVVKKHRPKLLVAGASAYPRIIDFKRMKEIADEVGCLFMVDMAHIAGLVAAGLHENPVPYADFVTSTTHKTLRGPRGGIILAKEEYGKKINSAVFPGLQGGPLMHIIAAKAVAFLEALQPSFKAYQQNVVDNAKALGESLNKHGVNLVSGGTDTHLLLIDLRGTECNGKVLQERLDEVNITTNKNTVPYETEKATITSGLRIGTPALTTRGFGVAEMELLGELISLAIFNYDESKERILKEVADLCEKFPLYADLK